MAGDTTRLAGVSQRHATGQKALIAEVLCAGVAIGPGLPVPELVLVEVDPLLGRSEPDEEVQNLLTSSPGLNLGMDFLPRRPRLRPRGPHPGRQTPTADLARLHATLML